MELLEPLAGICALIAVACYYADNERPRFSLFGFIGKHRSEAIEVAKLVTRFLRR